MNCCEILGKGRPGNKEQFLNQLDKVTVACPLSRVAMAPKIL